MHEVVIKGQRGVLGVPVTTAVGELVYYVPLFEPGHHDAFLGRWTVLCRCVRFVNARFE